MNAAEAAVAAFSAAGTPAGLHDILIAEQAKARGVTLVTNNTSEFARMAGLRVEGRTG